MNNKCRQSTNGMLSRTGTLSSFTLESIMTLLQQLPQQFTQLSYGLFSFTVLPHSYGKMGLYQRFLLYSALQGSFSLFNVFCFYHWFRCFCFNSKISDSLLPCAGRFLSHYLLPCKLMPCSKKYFMLNENTAFSLIPTSKHSSVYGMMIVNQLQSLKPKK